MKKIKNNPLAVLIAGLFAAVMIWSYHDGKNKAAESNKKIEAVELKLSILQRITEQKEDTVKILSERLSCALQENAALDKKIKKSNENYAKKYYRQRNLDSKRDTLTASETKYLLTKHRLNPLERSK